MRRKPKHLSWLQIFDAVENPERLDRERDSHMDSCEECRERMSSANRLIKRLEHARLPHPPRPLVDETLRQVRAQSAPIGKDSAWQALLDRVRGSGNALRAMLVTDSMKPSPAVRGTLSAMPRMLLFETADHSISVSVNVGSAPTVIDVIGQVIPRTDDHIPEGGWIALHGEDYLSEAPLEALGEFSFQQVPLGRLSLLVAVGDQTIHVDPLLTDSEPAS